MVLWGLLRLWWKLLKVSACGGSAKRRKPRSGPPVRSSRERPPSSATAKVLSFLTKCLPRFHFSCSGDENSRPENEVSRMTALAREQAERRESISWAV